MTDKPEYKNWITPGNFLQIATTLVLVGAMWGSLSNSINALVSLGTDHEARIRVLETLVRVELTKISTELEIINKAIRE